MDRVWIFVFIGFVAVVLSSVSATLTINEISGPDYIEVGSQDELVLDCDFTAENEEDVVLKWFFNGLEQQIYQWIPQDPHAYALGVLKPMIDNSFKISNDPRTMLRALKFKEVTPELTGNYTCKVESTDSEQVMTKQVIIYSPATSFDMFLMGGDDEFPGDEIIFCDAKNILPKPEFNLYVSGVNGSLEEPEMFEVTKRVSPNDDGVYNMSITLAFNASYLDVGTTRFVCQLDIPGTNYSEVKSVEYFVDSGKDRISSSIYLVLLIVGSLVFAT
ncbi:uncharacterized protein LOC126748475 isoform X2 [Anthonomus grandis grandis]|uniref:uncharacterized protein LOC126748475 isoform X2 n=1 Tax=Anthonomus grandis grandis TaxID=2921223 RepID=UPI0021652811|nr:uncharacterized protein LOC126748475 isoform X2 [Anthonomus grandis grandis]